MDVVFWSDGEGSADVLQWLDALPQKVQDKFIVRIERLAECGHELRRPEAALLRDGVRELRVHHMRVNYRVLYFFEGGKAVLTHGITKEDQVPDKEIERAIERRDAYRSNPRTHTYVE